MSYSVAISLYTYLNHVSGVCVVVHYYVYVFCKGSLIYINPLLSEGAGKSGMQNHFWCVLLSKAFHANTWLDPYASLFVSVQTMLWADYKTIYSDNPYNLKDSYGVLNVTKV